MNNFINKRFPFYALELHCRESKQYATPPRQWAPGLKPALRSIMWARERQLPVGITNCWGRSRQPDSAGRMMAAQTAITQSHIVTRGCASGLDEQPWWLPHQIYWIQQWSRHFQSTNQRDMTKITTVTKNSCLWAKKWIKDLAKS